MKKRVTLLAAGLFITAAGVTFLKKADLGISPNSTVANAAYEFLPGVSLGTWLFLWNVLLLLGQVLVLRKRFRPYSLLQIPLAFAYGRFADLWMYLLAALAPAAYPLRLLTCGAGILLLGLGITLTAHADLIMNAGEAFVKAVADVTGKPFGTVKVGFDVGNVLLAAALSLALLGHVTGIREGTVIAALCTGMSCRLFQKLLYGRHSPVS